MREGVVLSMTPRSQAARGKEKEKDGTTDSGIKLEPVPGLPGGECNRVASCQPSSLPALDAQTAPMFLPCSTRPWSLAPAVALSSQQELPRFKGGVNNVAQLSSLLTLGCFLQLFLLLLLQKKKPLPTTSTYPPVVLQLW